MMGGYLLLHRAVVRYLGLRWRGRSSEPAILAGFVVIIALLTYPWPDTRLRIVAVSLAFAAQVVRSALLLFRSASEGATRAAERQMAGVLLALGAFNALRAVFALSSHAPADLMRADALQAASFLAFILLSSAVAFGFISMAGTRVQVALRREANLDALTGLLNRRGFLGVAPARLQAARRERRDVLLLFADVDDLKRVNDTAGHDAGDRAICEAADVLRDVLRASDSIARLGGDEFCALVPVRDEQDSAVILARLEERIRAYNERAGREYALGISAAIVPVHPSEGRSLEELLRDVDRGMYAKKKARQRAATEVGGGGWGEGA
jgi:diguanylate cyclase (GGDEF)-like protein